MALTEQTRAILQKAYRRELSRIEELDNAIADAKAQLADLEADRERANRNINALRSDLA